MRDGQPVCPRCELRRVEKLLNHRERRCTELREESLRRGKIKFEQAEKIRALEREVDEVRRQLGAEILRAGQAEDELRRLAAEAQPATKPDTATLAAALDGLHTLIATSSRDWGTYRVDAWLWAVLCGWDCEQTEHDETCTHGAMEEMQQQHGWSDETVTKARRYRAAVRALTAPAAGVPQDGAQHGTETEPPAKPECAHCWREIENRGTPNMGGPQRDHWVHVPGGFAPCFPQRGADSPRAEPRTVEAPQ
ncbi:hypothetical protein, partial [Streptomyces adelaidensis]|uniref:hypothetical protein n=1 Tax=Streptomyces adelaidensis TaxID=2796465 RepID=UPI001903DAF5